MVSSYAQFLSNSYCCLQIALKKLHKANHIRIPDVSPDSSSESHSWLCFVPHSITEWGTKRNQTWVSDDAPDYIVYQDFLFVKKDSIAFIFLFNIIKVFWILTETYNTYAITYLCLRQKAILKIMSLKQKHNFLNKCKAH